MNKLRRISPLSIAVLAACLSTTLGVRAQPASAPNGNKAGKPPTDAAASQAGMASKQPSKPGAQSGALPASAAGSGAANKAARPPTDEAASRAGVATKQPAKAGAQSGPMPASAPK